MDKKNKTVVIALGGNALGTTPIEMKKIVSNTVIEIIKLIKKKYNLLICHGNGPQVGIINDSFFEANKDDKNIPQFPLNACNAMSQGYIGHYLQAYLINELKKNKINRSVNCILSHTIVDVNDNAIKNPSKPIGQFYKTYNEAIKKLPKNSVVKEDSGRGYRQVVPSPHPINFIGIDTIKELVKKGNIVIFGGGGGIPFYKDKNGFYQELQGVIDKDFTGGKLAECINADEFIILTDVDNVLINFRKPNQKILYRPTYMEIQKYLKLNMFGKGSMEPKVIAASTFAKKCRNKLAIIGNINKTNAIIEKKSGTIFKF